MMGGGRSAYDRDGFLFPLEGVSSERALATAIRVQGVIEHPPTGVRHPWRLSSHLLFDWIYNLAVESTIVDAVDNVIGPDLLLLAVDVFAKPPNSDKVINWHQDANYWGLEPFNVCTAWLALTEATVANGCMQYLPSSQRRRLEHVETHAADSMLSRGQEIDGLATDHAVDVILDPGQISLHHCLMAHASGPNRTSGYRIGLAMRFVPADTRQTSGPPLAAVAVRGRTDHAHIQLVAPPTTELSSTAVATHDRVLAPHAEFAYCTA